MKACWSQPLAELWETRICDLPLPPLSRDSRRRGGKRSNRQIILVRKAIAQLDNELKRNGLPHLQPTYYWGDEWFSPEGMNAIALPFYLAHAQLKKLQRTLLAEVEGHDLPALMRFLRHETGHCFDHAYGISARKSWEKHFGSTEEPYRTQLYRYELSDPHFVENLDEGYAQSHPLEDFAETFAVWLDPQSQWQRQYAAQPALKKLLYIDRLVQRYGQQLPRTASLSLEAPWSATRMQKSVADYYEARL